MSTGWKIVIGIVIAAVVIGIAVSLFQYIFAYGLIFLAVVGAIALVRQIIVASRSRGRRESAAPGSQQVERKAHRELKKLEKRIRR